jgi:hypothetical protein
MNVLMARDIKPTPDSHLFPLGSNTNSKVFKTPWSLLDVWSLSVGTLTLKNQRSTVHMFRFSHFSNMLFWIMRNGSSRCPIRVELLRTGEWDSGCDILICLPLRNKGILVVHTELRFAMSATWLLATTINMRSRARARTVRAWSRRYKAPGSSVYSDVLTWSIFSLCSFVSYLGIAPTTELI